MGNKIKKLIGMGICDFGLWILSLGPKDTIDRQYEKVLIKRWKEFKDLT